MRSFILAFVAILAVPVMGHTQMIDPAPFRSPSNKNAPQAQYDYSMTSPLKQDGSDFPCKGYHSDFGTPGGAPTSTYAPGGKYSVSVAGAQHGGGSCQLSLSYDKGTTWEVIKSIMGNCPAGQQDTIDFEMPADVQTGTAIFAWTWFNNQGVREMYMNCAAVEITGDAAKRNFTKRASRPAMFTANIGNGCTSADNRDVLFPNPGSVVETRPGRGGLAPAAPEGTCQAADPSQESPQAEGAKTDATNTPNSNTLASTKQCKRWKRRDLN